MPGRGNRTLGKYIKMLGKKRKGLEYLSSMMGRSVCGNNGEFYDPHGLNYTWCLKEQSDFEPRATCFAPVHVDIIQTLGGF